MASRRWHLNLRAKLLATLLMIAVTPLGVLGYVTIKASEHFLEQSLVDSLRGLAELKVHAIDAFIADRSIQAEKMAALPALVTNVAMMSDMTRDEQSQQTAYQALNADLRSLFGQGAQYEEIFVADTTGRILVSTIYEHEQKIVEHAAFFSSGLKTTTISDPFRSDLTEQYSMVIATPIKDAEGKVLGLCAARLNLEAFYNVIRLETGLGETGETVVGKRVGDQIIFMAPTRYDEEAALRRKVVAGSPTDKPLQEAARGAQGQGFYTDYRDTRVLAAYVPVPTLGWGLVVKRDAVEALQPLVRNRRLILLVAFGLLLLVLVLSSALSKGIVGPLRELTEAADQISRGQTDVKLNVRARDEVGDLADSFERMIAAVRFLKDQQ